MRGRRGGDGKREGRGRKEEREGGREGEGRSEVLQLEGYTVLYYWLLHAVLVPLMSQQTTRLP